jgi:hypothetical protein
MKVIQNAESKKWLAVYAGRKRYQNKKPAEAGCLTSP